jgi:hypothetical protein
VQDAVLILNQPATRHYFKAFLTSKCP